MNYKLSTILCSGTKQLFQEHVDKIVFFTHYVAEGIVHVWSENDQNCAIFRIHHPIIQLGDNIVIAGFVPLVNDNSRFVKVHFYLNKA
jgi:hypothetical protein